MKKLLPLCFVVFYAIGFTSYELAAKTPVKPSSALFTPQISIAGPDMMTVIANGDTTPDMLDGTLYFEIGTGNSLMTPFSIQNSGTSDLNISDITITGTDVSDFVLNDMWSTTVLAGSTESFEVSFAPQSAGVKNAIVTITSDDPTNGTYTFAIQGTAFEGATGLHFDGVDDNITFNNGNYSLSDDFSIEFWMKPDISGTDEHFILDNTSGSSGYSLRIDITQQLNFTFFTASGVKNLSTSTIANDQWQHVAIVYNDSGYSIFIDGMLDNSLALSEAIVDSSNNLTMGSAFGGGEYYAGAIDELRVWDVALSSCRISDQSSCQLTGSESDLLAYYNFNNGEVNGNNFPMFSILDPNHTITSGIPPQGTLNNFGLTGTTSNWIDTTANGISGTCNTYSEAIIGIASNSNAINNGDTTVSSSNNTSFGNVEFGQAEPADYTINNTGSATLNISNIIIDGASDFTIIESPTTVAAGASENLRILFTPASIGTKNATVRILNDDCDDATFEFAIEGTGFTPATGLSFDGTDDHISINHNSAFNTSIFTIEAYFKTTSTAGGQAIISKYDTTGINGFSLFLNSSGGILFEYAVPNIESTSASSVSGLNDGNWHHIALAFGYGKVIYYIDGVLDNEITFSNIPDAPTNTESLYIGYSAFNNVYFNGDIDEVRYWSRTLCSDEILAQQSCELVGNESGLVAYYDLNQGNVYADNSSETTADDATSNNLDGTLTNFALTGSTSNWIDTTTNGISGNCSVAFPEINVQGDGNDILNGDATPDTSDNTDAGSVLVGNSAEMSFFVRNTDGSGALHIDGVILMGDTGDFTITQNPSNNAIPATESASLKIEFTPTSGGTKTATVIISSDDCDEPDYTFTIQGTGIPAGTGLDFDGANDLVTISHDNGQNNLNFSVDFWIKTTDGLGGVINKFTPDGNSGWRINLDGGRIEFYYYASASNYVTRLLSPATSVNDGNWHHVAVTLNSGNARCYIDGVLARSTGWNGTATATTTTADIQLGYAAADAPSGDTGGYFDGQLDELRIWTKTLSEFEVGQLNGCTTDMSQAGLTASYNFNEGIAAADNSGLTTLADGSGNNYNGTLTNFALTGATSNWIDAADNNVSGSCDCVVTGGVTLTTQAEVDNFVTTTLGSCGIIEGDVTINGTITDVSGFSNLHTISGDLHLEGNIVDDLSGFNSLTTIGGNFTLKDMTNTTSISDFSNITSLGGNFEVNNLDQLTEISIFDQIAAISSITITGNSMLSTITFDELQTMSSSFVITFNGALGTISVPKLTDVSGEFRMNNNSAAMTSLSLPLLESTGNFRINDMNGLESINAPELLTVTGSFNVGSCAALTTLTIPKLTSIDNNTSIDNCTQLTTINTTSLSTVSGNFSMDDLAISSLSFLQNVTSIGGGLLIRDMVNLSTLQGLDELTTLGSFSVNDCDLLTSLEGFPKLGITSINLLNIAENELITTFDNSFLTSLTAIGALGISFNGNLVEIDALQNLVSLTGGSDSTIRNNNSLQSINLYALRNVNSNLIIQNQELGISNLCGLYNYVTVGDGNTTLSFVGANAADWDSVQDIIDNCETPVITLIGDNPQTIELGAGYSELGASTSDGSSVVIDSSEFVDAIGSYTITYNAVGISGNNAIEVTRTVNVVDTTAPVITLEGDNPQAIELGAGYTDLGSTTDDGSSVSIDTSEFMDAVGSYTIYYDATDAAGNAAVQVTRTVNVVDTTAPVITLEGDNPQTIELGVGYSELGATTDDGSSISIDTSEFMDVVDSYTIYYDATDTAGNDAVQVTRTVNVVDTTAPVITLDGANPQTIELGAGYTELGATTDDGSSISIDTSEFMDAVGNYTIYYDATDAAGNAAVQVTRTVNVVDTTAPVITLDGANPQTIELGAGYTELGAITDDGTSVSIDTSEFMDTVGSYTIYYDATDAAGNAAVQATRTVNVVDTTAPVITLDGANPQTIELGVGYSELGATTDDGTSVSIDTSEFMDAVGNYTIYYDATDAAGNAAVQVTRTVNVVDTTAPVITLDGANPQTIELGAGYTELGATTDDGSSISIDTSEFMDAVGNYTIYYDATDAAGNAAVQVNRTVNVVDTTAPVITLDGANPQTIALGAGYTELGAITDDGTSVSIDTSEFMDTVGSYIIYYDATDASGNAAAQVTRTVNVVDTTAPVITLNGANPQTIALGAGYTELGATTNDGTSVSIDTSEFMDAIGSYTIYYDATDASGNAAAQVTRTVNVVDTTNPIAVCQNITVQLDDTGNISITAAMIDNGSSDLSGMVSLALDITDFDCTNIGDNMVVLTVTDTDGNSDMCMATVTVEDTIAPEFDMTTVPTDMEVPFDTGDMYTLADFTNGVVVTDNCDTNRAALATTITQTPAAGTLLGAGDHLIILTVTDDNANEQTTTFTITVTDDVLSVGENKEEVFTLYPNPAKQQFQVSGFLGKVELSIYDVNGRSLLKEKVDANQSISIQELPNGVYFVKIAIGTTYKTIQLMKNE
ncbi:immunoglobulin-like domain-containing protein [uncultured Aquimarina sp.]|uniref:immunoglobulin-like domain-containing protein n=1 Tax=uncultured Aquimarina sp. TaxID=575652 RepID=UPI0026050BD9|nr:immunoglobulin-like domain-containing protein [uncultured Aquimarina sp.]